MASDCPDGGSPPTDPEVPGGDDARATVEWYFGDLIERVSVDHPLSSRELRAALAAIEYEGRRQEERLRSVGSPVHCVVPGAVFRLPSGTWHSLESAGEIEEREAVAARDVHRRMARSVTEATAAPDTGADLFVLCRPRHAHMG